jgi:hypothetical protein
MTIATSQHSTMIIAHCHLQTRSALSLDIDNAEAFGPAILAVLPEIHFNYSPIMLPDNQVQNGRGGT